MNLNRFADLNLWRELIVIVRFGLIGLAATTVHLLVAWLLLIQFQLKPLIANSFAFLVAFFVSFTGNYFWTFKGGGNPARAIMRFFVIATAAFFANSLLLNYLIGQGWFSSMQSLVISVSIVPMISYTASRVWGFK